MACATLVWCASVSSVSALSLLSTVLRMMVLPLPTL
jgi:hypothetical protein